MTRVFQTLAGISAVEGLCDCVCLARPAHTKNISSHHLTAFQKTSPRSIFLTTTARDTPWYPWAHSNFLRLCASAQLSTGKVATLANHPREADCIVFVEPMRLYQSDVRRSPLYMAYQAKSVVLDFFDNARPSVPGIYVGLASSLRPNSSSYRGGFYLRVADNAHLDRPNKDATGQDTLFSFIGNVQNHVELRSAIMGLRHSRSILIDRSTGQRDDDVDYVRTIHRSKFVLAPRGLGPSSWRLFETMRAGRVPVVISDDWVPPNDVDWEKFAVRLAERDVSQIPARLERLEPRAGEMGRFARQAYVDNFSSLCAFDWVASQALSIVESGNSVASARSRWMTAHRCGELSNLLREEVAVRIGR